MLSTSRRALAGAVRRALADAAERGVSARQAARRMGRSHATLSDWQHGLAAPSRGQVAELVAALDVPAPERGELLALAVAAGAPEPDLIPRLGASLVDAAPSRALEILAAHCDATDRLCPTSLTAADLRGIAANLPAD